MSIEKAPTMVERIETDRLITEVYENRSDLGVAAAWTVAAEMRSLLEKKQMIRVIFASAPSQNEFLATLKKLPGIDWDRVTAFHMDEYVGLEPDAPQSFSHFLEESLFSAVKPAAFHKLNGMASDLNEECQRYRDLLKEGPVDIVCAGIGENGHLAFNDPPMADFNDPKTVKVVDLTLASREQQVHDGCFPNLGAVPTQALTLTVPALMAAGSIYCMVPGPTKAAAVRDTLLEPISTACPATIMRRHGAAWLYVDRDSAALYMQARG